MISEVVGDIRKIITLAAGARTSKIMMVYLACSTVVLVATVWQAPEQLANAGIAVGSMGAGGAAFKVGNAAEAKYNGKLGSAGEK